MSYKNSSSVPHWEQIEMQSLQPDIQGLPDSGPFGLPNLSPIAPALSNIAQVAILLPGLMYNTPTLCSLFLECHSSPSLPTLNP